MEFGFGNMWKSPLEAKKKIKLGSPKLDEPGIISKAKFIPSFDLNLEKPDDVPRLIESDLEHRNVKFSDSTEKYDLRVESRNVHNPKADINDENVIMDHFEHYKKTNPDERLYEPQENLVKAQFKAKAMPEQELSDDCFDAPKIEMSSKVIGKDENVNPMDNFEDNFEQNVGLKRGSEVKTNSAVSFVCDMLDIKENVIRIRRFGYYGKKGYSNTWRNEN